MWTLCFCKSLSTIHFTFQLNIVAYFILILLIVFIYDYTYLNDHFCKMKCDMFIEQKRSGHLFNSAPVFRLRSYFTYTIGPYHLNVFNNIGILSKLKINLNRFICEFIVWDSWILAFISSSLYFSSFILSWVELWMLLQCFGVYCNAVNNG